MEEFELAITFYAPDCTMEFAEISNSLQILKSNFAEAQREIYPVTLIFRELKQQ